MAMLAEPRRKQKIINLRAKNNAWSNDANKFGQRMLEKMGWSSGKGLGAKENGIVEHVIAKYKNDDKGLGYTDKNDQWTKHENDFNAILANLSTDNDKQNEVLHSGVSLEVKSKKSKARIHYHKFTRGKDLSRYSEKDLANIFGKRSFKEEVKPSIEKDEMKSTEQVFEEKGSMEDYFKSKMAALKTKLPKPDDNEENPDFVFQGFALDTDDTTDKVKTVSFYNNDNDEVQELTTVDYTIKKKSKKNKKKKSEHDEITNIENITTGNCVTQDDKEIPISVSKSVIPKKRKTKLENTVHPECISNIVDLNTDNIKKSKKKIKNKQTITEAPNETSVETEEYVPKKKKKKKNKDL